MFDFQKIEGFQWDKGNIHKNEKHGIHFQEAEQIFTNEPLLLLADEKHSQGEKRYHAIGSTNEGRILHVSFTLREQDTRIRVISAAMPTEKKGVFMNKKKLKPIPKFKSEEEEREFWATHDTTEYLDWSKAVKAKFPNLKLSTRSISLRLPVSLLEDIKIEANKKDVPYQSLIKVWLAEKVRGKALAK